MVGIPGKRNLCPATVVTVSLLSRSGTLVVFLSDSGGEVVLGDPATTPSQFCSHSKYCAGLNSISHHYSIEYDDGSLPFDLQFATSHGKVCVPPTAGSAVLVYNTHADGSFWETSSMSSCPVKENESQWILRTWQHAV
jgi:hypothetical protein